MLHKKISYKVSANDFDFEFSEQEAETADMIKKSPGLYHILQNNRSVNVKMLAANMLTKKFVIEVEGQSFNIEIKDELDMVLDKMGFGLASHKHIKEIKAPMPGLVLAIVVTEGQEVNAGETLLILQAMKMENSITVHAASAIKRIAVVAGQAVEKGQLLIELV